MLYRLHLKTHTLALPFLQTHGLLGNLCIASWNQPPRHNALEMHWSVGMRSQQRSQKLMPSAYELLRNKRQRQQALLDHMDKWPNITRRCVYSA